MGATSSIIQKEFEYRISCTYSYDSTSNVAVTWKHNSNAFSTAQEAKVSDENTGDVNLLRKVYTLNRASETDAGLYHCETSYGSGSHTETASDLSLTIRGSDSDFRTYNSVGSSSAVTCTIFGDESTTLTWKKPDYTDITTSGDYTVGAPNFVDASKETTSTLTISNLMLSHSGDYKCVAIWVDGVPNNITHTVMITVPGMFKQTHIITSPFLPK